MSLLKWLGIDSGDSDPTDSVAQIEKALTDLEPDRARFIACFAYILGRVARADHEITPSEADAMIAHRRRARPPARTIRPRWSSAWHRTKGCVTAAPRTSS